jgi:hypothetical protein
MPRYCMTRPPESPFQPYLGARALVGNEIVPLASVRDDERRSLLSSKHLPRQPLPVQGKPEPAKLVRQRTLSVPVVEDALKLSLIDLV